MATINQIRGRLQKVNVSDISVQSIEETKEGLIDRQQDQLRYGLNSKGGKIGRYKNADHPIENTYAKKKNAMNPLAGYGNVDLIYEKDFSKGIKVEVTPDVFKTTSTDPKFENLQEKYGESILGLNEDYTKGYVKQDLRPLFMKKIRNATGL